MAKVILNRGKLMVSLEYDHGSDLSGAERRAEGLAAMHGIPFAKVEKVGEDLVIDASDYYVEGPRPRPILRRRIQRPIE